MKKYTNQVVIKRPIDEVVRMYADAENFQEWQPDLEEYDVFEGTPFTNGAKARVKYRIGNHDFIKAVEVIEESNLPEIIRIRYETDGVLTYHTSYFQEVADGKTLFEMESEYDTDGLMQIMDFFNSSHFEKQSRKFMNEFKDYVESHSIK